MKLSKFISFLLLVLVLTLQGPQHLYLFHDTSSVEEQGSQCSETRLHFDSGLLLEHEADTDCTVCRNTLSPSDIFPVSRLNSLAAGETFACLESVIAGRDFLSCVVSRGPPSVFAIIV